MKTRLLKLTGDAVGDGEALGRAAKLLADGAMVAFPTETVYGLGANAKRPETVERLYRIKGRPRSKPFTVHVADLDAVDELVGPISEMGRRLMASFWPGPLTIIFTRPDGSTVGVRLPDNEVARALIRKAGCPVLAPSANLSGENPATSAKEVLTTFQGSIEAVLDGGPTRFGQSSTVVRLVGDGYEMVREGVLSVERLDSVSSG